MKRRLSGAAALLVLCGCTSVQMAKYTVTSFPEVPLKDKAKVKIVSNGDAVKTVAQSVRNEFAKNGGFEVVDNGADYWFIVSGLTDYTQSESQNVLSVVKDENEAGGVETLAPTKHNLASAAFGASVAVYNSKTLSPVHYFEIPIWNGDNSEKEIRSKDVYTEAFSQEVVERVKDAFLTQQKEVETPMPLKADAKLRNLFAKRDYKAFLLEYKKLGTINLAKVAADVRNGVIKEKEAIVPLSNYYLYLLVEEASTQDPAKLREVMAEHQIILRTTQYDGIAEAVPVALARLEYKLANITE